MAYRDYATSEAVCYPLPFNWLVRWARQLYWWLVWPGKDKMEWAYSKGVAHGRKVKWDAMHAEGVREGRKQVLAELETYSAEKYGRRKVDLP